MNRYHTTRGFVESSRTLRWTNNQLIRYQTAIPCQPASAPEVRTETFTFDSQNSTAWKTEGQTLSLPLDLPVLIEQELRPRTDRISKYLDAIDQEFSK